MRKGYDKWERDRGGGGGGGGGGGVGGGGGGNGGASGSWASRERDRERERDRQARAGMTHANAAEPDASSLFPAPFRVTGNRDRVSQQIQIKLGDYQLAQMLLDDPSKSIGICAEPPSPAPCPPSRRESEFKKPSHAPQNGRVQHRPTIYRSDVSGTASVTHKPPPLRIPNGVQTQHATDNTSSQPPIESILKEMKSLPTALSAIAATPRKEMENKFIFNDHTNRVQEVPQINNTNNLKSPLPKPGLDNRILNSRTSVSPGVVKKDIVLSDSDEEVPPTTTTRLEPIISPLGSGSPSSASESSPSDSESESSESESSGPAAPNPAPTAPAPRSSWSLSNFAPPPAHPPQQSYDSGKEVRDVLADAKEKPSPISELSESDTSSPSPEGPRRRRSSTKRISTASSDEDTPRSHNNSSPRIPTPAPVPTPTKRGRPPKQRSSDERPPKKKRGRPPKQRPASPPSPAPPALRADSDAEPERPQPQALQDTKTHIFRKVFTPKKGDEGGGKGGKGGKGKGKGGKGKGQVTIIEVTAPESGADDDERERSSERRDQEALARVSPPQEREPHMRRRDERIQERISDRIPERIPERMPERIPERVSDRIPERTQERIPERPQDRIPERTQERIPERKQERISERIQERISERPQDRVSERIPERIHERIPERVPERISDRIPERVPDHRDRIQERPTTERTSNDRIPSERTLNSDRLSNDRLVGALSSDRLSSDKSNDRLSGDKLSLSDKSSHERSFERISGDKSSIERLSADKSSLDRLQPDKSSIERISSERMSHERLLTERTALDRLQSEKMYERLSEKSSLKRLLNEKVDRVPSEKIERLSSEKPLERLPSEKLAAERLASNKVSMERMDRVERIATERYVKAEADVGSGLKSRGSERLEEASSNVCPGRGRPRLLVRVPLSRLGAETLRAIQRPAPRRPAVKRHSSPTHEQMVCEGQIGEVAATNHERTAGRGQTPIYYSYFERLPAEALSDEEKDHQYYLSEAKRLRTEAEREQETLSRVMLYLESVLCFVLTGRVLELDLDTKQAFTIYRETIEYIKSIHSMPQRFRASPHSTFSKLDILSLRVQALLYLRMFKMYNREVKEYNKIVQEYQQKPAGPESVSSVSPLSPTPSPAGSVGSVGSASSGYCSLVHAVPANAHHALLQLTKYYTFLYVAHDLWEQADTLCRSRANKDLFIAVDRKCGPLTLSSTFRHLVQYVRYAISLLKNSARE